MLLCLPDTGMTEGKNEKNNNVGNGRNYDGYMPQRMFYTL